MSSQTHIVSIGRTNYYTVRKGTQQYCIAEGRRVQDSGYCWQVIKDPESGKNFFINGNGIRRWHLPDIYQTEKERLEEERDLRFLREQKKKRKGKDGSDGASGAASDDDDDKDKKSDAGSDDGPGNRKPNDIDVEDMRETFASRDRAAAALVMLRGWETPEDRKPVVRFAKSVLRPYVTQGLVSEDLFSQLVMTGTREHCSQHAQLATPEDKEMLRRNLIALAQARVDEETRREEYLKMNNDLIEKVKRLDEERRQLTTDINAANKNEEKMKDELFQLRAHKQDVLLHSFKRLTRAGLVQAYWERWVRFKSIVETQMHIKARERRTIEMKKKIVLLEDTIQEREKETEMLRDLERQRQGKEVINRILKQLGKETLRRFYIRWLKHTLETKRSKEMQTLRRQIADCPRCVDRGIDCRRLADDVREKVREITSLNLKMTVQQESLSRSELASRSLQALSHLTSEAYVEACQLAQEAFINLKAREKRFVTQDEKVKQMSREIDGLKFEVSTGGRRNNDEDGGGAYDDDDDDGPARNNGSGAGKAGVGRAGGLKKRSGMASDGIITSYFQNDATSANSRMESRSIQRTEKLAGEKPYTVSLTGGPHGYIRGSTQSSIAPRVIEKMDPSSDSRHYPGMHAPAQNAAPARGQGAISASGLYRQPATVLVTRENAASLAVETEGDINVKFDVQRSQWYREAKHNNNASAGLSSPFDERTEELRPPSESDSNSSSDEDNSSDSSVDSEAEKKKAQKEFLNSFQQAQLQRRNQAEVLRFIRPPPGGDSALSPHHLSGAATGAPPPPEVDPRCEKCGFRYESAPFCPKDGSRHTYKSLDLAIPHDELVASASPRSNYNSHNQRHSALNPPTSEAVRESARVHQPARTFHDDLTGMLVLPEKTGATTMRLMSTDPEEAAQYLHLPPGRRPAPTGIQPPSPPRVSTHHPLVERHQSYFSNTSALRDSLDLNPQNYSQPKMYGADGLNGHVGISSIHKVMHPRDYNDGGISEKDATYRETLDHIRSTRITTENTRRILGKQNGTNGAVMGVNDDRSIIAGYNPSADPENALSLESRLFSSRDENYSTDLLDSKLDVPNYFNAATPSFASRSGNFSMDRVVPTHKNSSRNVPDSHRVQHNIQSFNQRQVDSDPQKRTSGWGQLFQYTDVLYDDRLGVKAVDHESTFGTKKESIMEKTTAAGLLGQQHRARPNMDIDWRK